MIQINVINGISREERREARRHLHHCNYCPEKYTCFGICYAPKSPDEDYACPDCWERIQAGEELERLR